MKKTRLLADKAISDKDGSPEWTTGQIKQSSHGKSLAGKEIR